MKVNKKVTEKIINNLLNILIGIFAIFLLISIYTSIQIKILGNDYANFFGYSMFEVQTGSMADTIEAGDWIIVKLTKKAKLNDIITFKQNNEYITHRVIQAYNGSYITKGDANTGKDDPIIENQIVGKVTKIIPNFGILRKTLFNPTVLITLVITLFIFSSLFKPASSNNKIKEKINILLKKTKKKKVSKNPQKKEQIFMAIDDKTIEKNVDKYDMKDIKKEVVTEEELEKTSLYRTISVDLKENSDSMNPKIEHVNAKEIKEIVKNSTQIQTEEDLEKTSLYRVIPVDSSELDQTFLEIAENEMKKAPKKTVVAEQTPQKESSEEPEVKGIDLEFLKSKKNKSKSKNIIDRAIAIKEEEIDEVLNILNKKETIYVNEASIKELFKNAYLNAKYFNMYYDKPSENDKPLKITKVIRTVAKKINADYKGKDESYSEKVDKYKDQFILFIKLDNANTMITDKKSKKEFYYRNIMEYGEEKSWSESTIISISDKIIEIQKKYEDILEYFLKKLETNTFNLKLNQISSKRNMFGLELHHNLSFSKIYSEYIIDKTYSEGLIAEDKLEVLITLLLKQLINDMLISDFNNRYLLYIPKNLYNKEKKLNRILKMLEDDYVKEHVLIVITIENLLQTKQIVKKIRKEGYHFATVFTKNIDVKDKNQGIIYISDYIFINKEATNASKILSYIPDDLFSKIIYENLTNKIGDFGE